LKNDIQVTGRMNNLNKIFIAEIIK